MSNDRLPTPSEISVRLFELFGLSPSPVVTFLQNEARGKMFRALHFIRCDDAGFLVEHIRYGHNSKNTSSWAIEVDSLDDPAVVEAFRWLTEAALK